MSTPADDEAVVLKAVRLACLKAYAGMLNNNFGKNCLTASAVGACVLAHYNLPFKAVAGYYTLLHPETGEPVVGTAFPHVWLETTHGITDLAYSGLARKILVLGQGIGFHDHAIRPTYSADATLPVFTGESGGPAPLPHSVLAAVAKDLTAYLAQSPPHVKRDVDVILQSAFDGTDEIKVSPEAIEGVAT